MKAKETRFEKYMKFWYGISGPLDEQKRQVMNQIGGIFYFLFRDGCSIFNFSGFVFDV